MASGTITSWKIDGETVEIVSDFIFGGSKITADGDWSHEIKRCLLVGRKVMTNLDSILKNRDITLPTEVCLVKAMVFPVVMFFQLVLHQLPELLKFMSNESVMPSDLLILCRPLLLPPSIFPSIRVFSSESALRIRWPKDWSFSFNISPTSEYPGLIS